MRLIDTICEQDFRNTPETDRSGYYRRRAVRAVLLDKVGKVFLMHVSLHGYHKLPGGGIEESESMEQALARELMEEVGCKAEILAEVGKIVEYRDFEKMVQTSYCYIAQQVGEIVGNSLEAYEIADEMIELKADSIPAAIELCESDAPDNIEGLFIQRRDGTLLREAQKLQQ